MSENQYRLKVVVKKFLELITPIQSQYSSQASLYVTSSPPPNSPSIVQKHQSFSAGLVFECRMIGGDPPDFGVYDCGLKS